MPMHARSSSTMCTLCSGEIANPQPCALARPTHPFRLAPASRIASVTHLPPRHTAHSITRSQTGRSSSANLLPLTANMAAMEASDTNTMPPVPNQVGVDTTDFRQMRRRRINRELVGTRPSVACSFPPELIEMVVKEIPVLDLMIAASEFPAAWRAVVESSKDVV